MISQETIQQILHRLDIVDVIGGFVKLKKRGSNYLGLCPFHNERTPSFTVSPSKEIYKCFGCGRSGNAISFLMEHEKYSYVESLRWLAARYGVEVEETFRTDEQKQALQTAESLFIINQFAQQFFTKNLFETDEGREIGLSYLKERGFREDVIRKFQLGYNPEARDRFTKAALNGQYNKELLLKTGLIAERNGQLVDNYRGRIIFPVHNNSGKVLGFGARVLTSNEKAPKYINTPENEIYVKSKVLYGSHLARKAIDQKDECLLVEGYTDVISLHQAGIENVVASGGTSLTQDQLRIIKKYTKNLIIVYDGDPAGVKAALRGLDLALEEGLHVKLVLIPDNLDPDSFVNKAGASGFTEFIRQHKKDFILFRLDLAMKDAENDSTKKAEVINSIAETISRINKVEDFSKQQDYIRQCAQLMKIDEAGMHALVNQYIRNRVVTQEKALPFGEARFHEERAQGAGDQDYDEATYTLLFKDELQEKELVRILLEHGHKKWNEKTIAEYLFDEIMEEDLLENEDVVRLISEYKKEMEKTGTGVSKNSFVYHPDLAISSMTVSILNFPYDESEHWKKEFSNSTGYQKKLFELDYREFLSTVSEGNEKTLMSFLKMDEDRTMQEVESVLNHFKLKKIRKMLLENQRDMEKEHSAQELEHLMQTHEHLKKMEIEISRSLGGVIIR